MNSLTSSAFPPLPLHQTKSFPDFVWCEKLVPFEVATKHEDELLNNSGRCLATPGCFIWSMDQGLVVPRSISTSAHFLQSSETMQSLGWPLFIRQTGGDLTPQAPGMINISYVFAEPRTTTLSIEAMYLKICQPVMDFLKNSYGISAYCSSVEGAFCDGKFNIVVDGFKIAGTAQKWRQVKSPSGEPFITVLGHIAILGDVPLSEMISASNRFYECCHIEKTLTLENHTTLYDLLGSKNYDKHKIMAGLLSSFKQAC